MHWIRFALPVVLFAIPAQAQTPGNDFFGYANHDWLAAAVIPDGRDRWTARNDIERLTWVQLDSLFARLASVPPASLGGKVQAFLTAYGRDTSLRALQPQLDSIDAIRDKAALTRFLGRDLGTDADPLNWGTYQSAYTLGLAVEAGLHGERTNVVILTQGGAGAEPLADGSASDSNSANKWTRADFLREAPGMDWASFLTAAGLGSVDTIIVWQPVAMTRLAARVQDQSLAEWKAYLKTRLTERYRTSGSATDAAVRWLPEAVGQLYAERYFPPREKARLERIVAGVTAAFRNQVAQTAWLSQDARSVALAKLDSIHFLVGYPDRRDNFSTLRLDPADRIGNQRRIEQWNYRRALGRIGKPVDRRAWWISAQRVVAILLFQQNSYNFPAAFLQAPKYDPTASDAANYGAIGAIVGHELSHYVDPLGADYGVRGELRHWWSTADHAGYDRAASKLGRQVAAYEPAPGLRIDTALTRTENVADLTGLRAAFAAHRAALGTRASDTAYVRQQDREFFLGFARSWRGVIREGALPKILKEDTHAPERYRIALVRNLDAWYAAFGVAPGDSLYLAPGDRVSVW